MKQYEIHILNTIKHGLINYSKWDLYENESDKDKKTNFIKIYSKFYYFSEKYE